MALPEFSMRQLLESGAHFGHQGSADLLDVRALLGVAQMLRSPGIQIAHLIAVPLIEKRPGHALIHCCAPVATVVAAD